MRFLVLIFFLLIQSGAYGSDISKDEKGSGYLIGPQDVIEAVIITGAQEERITATVQENGKVYLKYLFVDISGKTVPEAALEIKKGLEKFINNPEVAVSVKEYLSKKVSIIGSVQKPGEYPISGKLAILDLIAKAGGPLQSADIFNIQVTRKDGKVELMNIYKYLSEGDLSQNRVLNNGDIVYIPVQTVKDDKFYIFGEVKKPGVFPLGKNFGVLQALSLSEGYLPDALTDEIKIIRGGLDKPTIINSNLKELLKSGDLSQDVKLETNDIVFVPRTKWGDWNDFVRKVKPTFELINLPVSTVLEIKVLQDILKK